MEGVPSPLRAGSPATTTNSSADNVPNALRAGSPTVAGGAPGFSRPPLRRKNTSGSDRLSQLFPSRPPSAASVSPVETPSASRSRRTSYPSPLIPASEPAYRIPRAPAPPSFPEDTSYQHSPDPFTLTGAQPSLQSRSGTKRLFSRLNSLRSARSRGAEYDKLEDEEAAPGSRRLQGVAEVDEHVGYDLSGLDGGLPLRNFDERIKPTSMADALEQQRDLNEAGYAAEYERLEAQLGAGMNSIMEVPFTHQTAQPDPITERGHHRRDPSNAHVGDSAMQDALKEAEKTGGIVAVADVPVDISDFAGGSTDFETRSVLTTGRGDNEAQVSYVFPTDRDMPSWRPFSMGWPWLSLLVIIALALAGLQEYLCQLSMKSVRNDPEGGGLLQFTKASELTVLQYFTWKYAPVLFFVIYGILWQITDFEVKRLEPYYQLSKPTGATAAESLNMDYLSTYFP
jgi:hypothetical protein